MESARKHCTLPLVLSLMLAGCSDGGDGSVTESPTPEPTASALSLTAGQDTLDALGASVTVQAQVLDQFGHPMTPAPSPSWRSSEPGVATVERGVVTAASNGSTLITATVDSVSSSVEIWVVQEPAAVVLVSGDDQTSAAGSELPRLLVVRVQDMGGSGVEGEPVQWHVLAGGGAVSEPQGTTDAAGEASTRWILGSSQGEQRLEASTPEGIAAPFTATATTPPGSLQIEEISPSVLLERDTAIITGTGLDGAAVTVDSRPAQVFASSESSLSFEVPVGDCTPTAPLEIRVSREGDEAVATAPVGPAQTIEPLEFGAVWMSFGTGPKGLCLHLDGRESPATYLIGVQSLSEVASSITPSNLELASAPAPSAVWRAQRSARSAWQEAAVEGTAHRSLEVRPAVAAVAAGSTAGGDGLSAPAPAEVMAAHHHAAHSARNLEVLRELGPPGPQAAARGAGTATALQNVGDEVTLKVPGSSCEDYSTIAGTVRAVGSEAIWIEDDARPEDGLTGAEYDELTSTYDELIGPELERLLGVPTDLDGNGRVVIVVSPEVNNLETVNGFVFTGDFFPASDCESSNHGEYFYTVVPDPGGTTERQLSVADALELYPRLLAHEMTHVVHFGQQVFLSGNPGLPEVWELEGLATFAEELVGHAATGNSSGQELGLNAVQQHPRWYQSMFQDLAVYSGFESPTSRITAAPHACTWLTRPPNGPCLGDSRLPYGVPASIFRWIADVAWTPGTEHDMTRSIVSATTHGLPLLSQLASEEQQWVLALWAIAVVADGRYFSSGTPTFSSWNVHDVFSGFHATARPTPMQASFDSAHEFDLRAGSMAYFLVEGSHEEIAIAARDLPSQMRLWVARVE